MATAPTLTRTLVTWGSFSALAGLVAVLAWQWAGSSATWVTHSLLVQKQLSALLSTLQDIEIGQRSYLLTDDKVQLRPFQNAKASFDEIQFELHRLTSDSPAQQALMSEAGQLAKKRMAIAEQAIALFDSGDRSGAIDLVRSGRGKEIMDQLRSVIMKADAQEERLFVERQKHYDQQRSLLLTALLVLMFATVGLAFLALLRERERLSVLAASSQVLAIDNEALSQRVAQRTVELEVARDRAEAERGRAEALLRDVTHRVGNNLALVVGFLNLHIRHASDPVTVETLMGARSRVHAIASAQRRINVTSDLELVRIDTLLEAVMGDLAAAVPENQTKIMLEVAPFLVEAQVATSVCVLTQEFVMNALKHAFPQDEPGLVTVRLARNSDGFVVLTVIDNGRGHARPDSLATSGLGTKIANLLASQFGGAITYKPSDETGQSSGTTVVVELPQLKLQPAGPADDQTAASASSNITDISTRRVL